MTASPDTVLTAELYETLKLLCRTGYTDRKIGAELGISRHAATDRVRRLLVLFGETSRVVLVTRCYRERIV